MEHTHTHSPRGNLLPNVRKPPKTGTRPLGPNRHTKGGKHRQGQCPKGTLILQQDLKPCLLPAKDGPHRINAAQIRQLPGHLFQRFPVIAGGDSKLLQIPGSPLVAPHEGGENTGGPSTSGKSTEKSKHGHTVDAVQCICISMILSVPM